MGGALARLFARARHDVVLASRAAARPVGECGFTPVDAGPLARARFLEPAAMLMVELVRGRGNPPAGVALHLLRRGAPEAAR